MAKFYKPDPEAMAVLMKKYKASGSIALRNEIVMQYTYIAKFIAYNMQSAYRSYAETEDIVNQGIITLIDAVERFDPELNVKFDTFATIKVRGAVIDYIRKQDFTPRRVRKLSKDVEEAYSALYSEFGRQPTNEELATYMGMSEDALNSGMQEISAAVTLSFEQMLEDNERSFYAANSNDALKTEDNMILNEIIETELTDVIATALEDLTEKEGQVIALYYYEKLKFFEIAKVLGVSEARVSQIHTKAILKLKVHLAEYRD